MIYDDVDKIEKLKKYYYVSKGTPYYLADRVGKLQPITFSISYDGSQFRFTPDNYVKGLEKLGPIFTQPLTDTSLLRGITRIMALATYFAVQYSAICHSKGTKNAIKDKDYRFYFSSEKATDIVTYIDYTNNMVFPDDKNYEPIAECIFPNAERVPPYVGFHKCAWMPKGVLPINYANMEYWGYKEKQKTFKDFFEEYLAIFKTELSAKLKAFKIHEQIDIPNKLVLYGTCNGFGQGKDRQGLISILYIENKTSASKYFEFKEMCNEKLDEYLKPFNLTHEDILNLTQKDIDEKYDTYQKIDKIARKCGYLKDPRGLNVGYHEYNYIEYNDEIEYSREFGLKRWEGIKRYYPDLWKGLKLIMDQYVKLATQYDTYVQNEYKARMGKLSDQRLEYLANKDDNITEKNIIKYVNNAIKDLKTIKLDDYSELVDTLQVLNQNILDEVSKLYQPFYKEQVKQYKYDHPRARKMTIIFDNDFFKQNFSSIQEILQYQPFNFNFLPKEIKDIFENKELQNLKQLLERFKLSMRPIPTFYVNNQFLKANRINSRGFSEYIIEDISNADSTLEFAYVSNCGIDENTQYLIDNDINEFCESNQSKDCQKISVEDFKQTICAFLSSPFKFTIKWRQVWFGYKPELITPLFDNRPNNEEHVNFGNWRFDSERSLDDIMTSLDMRHDNDSVEQYYAHYFIVCEYENPQLIVNKLKEVECIKNAINNIFEQP